MPDMIDKQMMGGSSDIQADVRPLTGAEAGRLAELLTANADGNMPEGGIAELRTLLGRWSAAHRVWEQRLFGVDPEVFGPRSRQTPAEDS